MDEELTDEKVAAVREKYAELFRRQPNVWSIGWGFLEDSEGNTTDRTGISIDVTKKVDQSTLPEEDRIPDCLEGVPIQINEKPNDADYLSVGDE